MITSALPKFGAVVMMAISLMFAASPSVASRPTTTGYSTPQAMITHSAATGVPITVLKTQVVVKGQFSGLVSGDGWLYSVESRQHGPGNTVVRLSPVSGHVVARSVMFPGVLWTTFVENTVWIVVALSKGAELVALNSMTLRKERYVPEASSHIALTGFGRGPLWAALDCKLVRLDPRSGLLLLAVMVRAGTQCELVMDNKTNRLFVEVGPLALRGQPATPTLLLQERNGSNGRLLASAIIPNPPNQGAWLAAADGNVWLAGGDPGVDGFIFNYRTSPLRLFASSCGECADPTRGGPGTPLPNTGQFPLVDISGGVVWVASASGVDCFNPRTALLEAIGRTYIVSGPILVTRDGAYGVASTTYPGLGIVRLIPPAGCRS